MDNKNNPYITTYTGREFHFMNPTPDEVVLEDIAHALSNLCRYIGHCSSFYSVAQHSVFIARYMPTQLLQMEALLHDGSEAYLGDLAAPIKRLCPEFKKIELRVDVAVRKAFGLPLAESPAVKEADMRVRINEWNLLFPTHKGALCDKQEHLAPLPEAGMILQPMAPMQAKKLFLDTYTRISKGMPI